MNIKQRLSQRLTKSSLSVRIVSSEEDCKMLFEAVRLFYREFEEGEEFQESKLLNKIKHEVLENANSAYTGFIAMKGGQLSGALIVTAGASFVSEEIKISNIFFYVLPKFRGSLVAIKLLLAYQQWAKLQNITTINLFVTSGYNLRSTSRLLKKLGFSMVGVNYQKNI